MAINPNPARITDPMWQLWEQRPNKAWRLGGIYADKKGYHNSVIANMRNWPNNYSIKLPSDLVNKNRDKARAIDLTMSDSEMINWTKNMKRAAENEHDTRLYGVKEFYGTLDGINVFGMAKDSATGRWRVVTSDKSHLWHGHTSIFTMFVDNWLVLAPILSVWKGETFKEWAVGGVSLPKQGDVNSEDVKYWQYVHNVVRKTVTPPSPALVADGDYLEDTAKAFKDFWKKNGGNGEFDGSKVTGWLALKYHQKLAFVSAPQPVETPPPPPLVSEEQLSAAVNAWLDKNLKDRKVRLEGKLDGEVAL
jgi:hypothetical protein